MSTGSVTCTLPYSCEQLFALAADIEAYPEYLPGWLEVQIIERSDTHLLVRQQLGLQLLRQPFTARAELDRPQRITVRSNDGPFRELSIEWRFQPEGSRQCRVSLVFSLALKSAFLAPMAALLFDQTAPLIVSSFERRAHRLYAKDKDKE